MKGLCRVHTMRPFKKQKTVILLYHKVQHEDLHDAGKLFKDQMVFLKENYKIIPLDELVSCFKNGKIISEHYAAVTFDDGYRDNFDIAYPVLKCLNIPATIYLAPGYLDSSDTKYLTWDMVNEMIQSGLVQVGNHTYSHLVLSAHSKDLQEKDIKKGRQMLEEMLDIEIISLAYPLGQRRHYTSDTLDILARDKYEFAVTAFTKNIEKPPTSIYEIPRVVMDGISSLEEFEIRLSGFWSNLQWCLSSIKK